MSITIHASSVALSPGSNLWILSNKEESRWTQKLDFYMNFQIAKSGDYSPQNLNLPIETIQEHFRLELPEYKFTQSQPLMIATHSYFPNRNTVMIPFRNSTQWLTDARKVCEDLGHPETRLFLPKSIDPRDVEKIWPKDKQQDLSLVLETPEIQK